MGDDAKPRLSMRVSALFGFESGDRILQADMLVEPMAAAVRAPDGLDFGS